MHVENNPSHDSLQKVAEFLGIPVEKLKQASMGEAIGWLKEGREKGWDPQLEASLIWGVAAERAFEATKATMGDTSAIGIPELELRSSLGRLVQETIDGYPLTSEQGYRAVDVILQFSHFVCAAMQNDPSIELTINTNPPTSSFLLTLRHF